jgi:hypothetical protein
MGHAFAHRTRPAPAAEGSEHRAPARSPQLHRVLQRKCACGGEADFSGQCAECKEQEGKLQRRAASTGESARVPPIVHDVLRSPGRPLDHETRAYMEPRFGHDFSKVKIHTDTVAAQSARAVNAHAYTVGQDIVFGAGQHSPEMALGKRLLAHELTHVAQQANGFQAELAINQPGDQYEQEADRTALAVSRGESSLVSGRADSRVACQLMRQHVEKPKGDKDTSDSSPVTYGPYFLPEVVITEPKPNKAAVCDVTFVKVQTREELPPRMRILNQQANDVLKFPDYITNPDILSNPSIITSTEVDLKLKQDHDRKAQEELTKLFGSEYSGAFFWWVRGGGSTGEGSPLWRILPAGAVFNRAYPPQAFPTQQRVYPDTRGVATQTEQKK